MPDRSGKPAGPFTPSDQFRRRHAHEVEPPPDRDYGSVVRDWRFWAAITTVIAALTTLFIVTWPRPIPPNRRNIP
jgi:hypothetical protein